MKTAQERIDIGKARRKELSRAALAKTHLKSRRGDPIEVLLSATEGRIRSLLPIKYSRMSANPFAFFRGAVALMATDLALAPHSGIEVQLCGDAHVQNLGSFAAPDGRLVFDLNDFDETISGPWEWDVKRMATSIILAGREAAQTRSKCRLAASVFVQAYCRLVAEFAHEPLLQISRHVIHRGGNDNPVHAALRESQRSTPLDSLQRYTKPVKGTPRFVDKKPVLWRVKGDEAKAVIASLESYRRTLAPERQHLFDMFRAIDVGFKVVGTGSVALRDYLVLLEGNGAADPLFLQIKQEVHSAYAPFLKPVRYRNHGKRAAYGQRAIQPLSDPLLGWTRCRGQDYLVRQLNDHKGAIDLETLKGDGLESLATVAGELLARGHARSGDPCEIFGYCGSGAKVTESVVEFASAYADQTEADFEAFLKNETVKGFTSKKALAAAAR